MSDELLICIAWDMKGEIYGGPTVDRYFLLIHEYVCFGMTNIETGKVEWRVTRHATESEARESALNLMAISERWGCTLDTPPHAREIRQSPVTTRRWLNSLETPDMIVAGLEATYLRTMRQGKCLDPEWSTHS